MKKVFPDGAVELEHPEHESFKFNGHRLKLYQGILDRNEFKEEFRLQAPLS